MDHDGERVSGGVWPKAPGHMKGAARPQSMEADEVREVSGATSRRALEEFVGFFFFFPK